MADEIKTRVTVLAEEAMRALKEIAKLEGDVGDAAEEAGRQTKAAGDQSATMAKGINFLKGEIIGLAGAMTGGFGIIKIWQDYEASVRAASEALKENAKLTRAAAEARLDLAALKGFESKEDVAAIGRVASFSGRDPGEVARTMTIIGGAIGPEKKEQIEALALQIGAKAQQTTTRMDQLAGPFVQLFKQSGDARVSANILEGAIDAAEEPDPGKVGEAVSKMLGMRTITKLGVGESAGFAAASTGLGISNEVASTAMRNTALALLGAGTPEGNEILEREGISRTDFRLGLTQTTQAIREGRITPQEIEKIGGKESLPFLGAMANKVTEDQFLSRVDAVSRAETMPGMLLSKKAQGIFSSDQQAMNLLSKQMESSIAATRGDDDKASRAGAARKTIEAILAKAVKDGTIDAANATHKLEKFDSIIARGGDPVYAAESVEFDTTFLTGLGRGINANKRFGPELGAGVFEALEMGPNVDPNVSRNLNIVPASGDAIYDPDINPRDRRSLSSAPVIIQNQYINSTVNGKPARERDAAIKEQK